MYTAARWRMSSSGIAFNKSIARATSLWMLPLVAL
jgi:hypothetical protein